MLAETLGMTLEECRAKIDAKEFHEWRLYDAIRPIGPNREDWQTARITQSIVAMLRSSKSRAPRISDFVPDWWKQKTTRENVHEREKQATQELIAVVSQMAFKGIQDRKRRGSDLTPNDKRWLKFLGQDDGDTQKP